MLHAHIWISFSYLSPACTCYFRALSSGLKKEENTLPAAMQPQNFRKAINGQAVDSYSGFLSSHSWKGGLPDLRISDAELQRCGRKVCACMQCAVCVILWPPSVCRKALRLTDCKVGVMILPDSISPFLSSPCHLQVFAFSCRSGLGLSQYSFLFDRKYVFTLCTHFGRKIDLS